MIKLTLISKPGCHLCDEARVVVSAVLGEFRAANTGVAANVQVEFQEISILEDQELIDSYGEEIPVLQINGATHAYWRIDPQRLRGALDEKALGL